MKVETFEVEQPSSEIATLAQDAAAVELCEQLGLSGQLTRNESNTLTRCPYRKLQEDENFVYSVLCPEKAPPERYSAEPIPLRVLQVLAHAKGLGVFCRFEIWSAKYVTVKDPVLIGYMKEGQWSEIPYILARWGAELMPVDEMIPAACKKYFNDHLAALKKIKAEVERELAAHEATRGIEMVYEIKRPYVSL